MSLVRHILQIGSSDDASIIHLCSVIGHRMRPDRKAGREEACHQSFIDGHVQQRRGCVDLEFVRDVLKKWTNVLPGAVPARQSAVRRSCFLPVQLKAPASARSISSSLRIEGTRRLRSYSDAKGPLLSCRSDGVAGRLPQSFYAPESKAHCRGITVPATVWLSAREIPPAEIESKVWMWKRKPQPDGRGFVSHHASPANFSKLGKAELTIDRATQ